MKTVDKVQLVLTVQLSQQTELGKWDNLTDDVVSCLERFSEQVEQVYTIAVHLTDTPDRLSIEPQPALTFERFQQLNAERCTKLFHPGSDVSAWWPIELWALAIAGEAGELANVCKKVVRGDFPMNQARPEILAELADVMTYCDLAFTRMHADTGRELLRKFDAVSARRGYPPVGGY